MILFSSISLQRETVKNLTSSFSTCSAARKTESKKLKKKARWDEPGRKTWIGHLAFDLKQCGFVPFSIGGNKICRWGWIVWVFPTGRFSTWIDLFKRFCYLESPGATTTIILHSLVNAAEVTFKSIIWIILFPLKSNEIEERPFSYLDNISLKSILIYFLSSPDLAM